MIPFLVPSLVVGGASLLSSIFGAKKAKEGAESAAKIQAKSTAQSIEALKAALAPYTALGLQSAEQQKALMGLSGAEAQAAAVGAIEGGAEYKSLVSSGENAILQNAAATGGLRGGNVQSALAQFRPQVLSQLINQQYSRLAGLTSMGAGVASSMGGGISSLISGGGTAQANAALASANAQAQMYNAVPTALMAGLGTYAGLGGKF